MVEHELNTAALPRLDEAQAGFRVNSPYRAGHRPSWPGGPIQCRLSRERKATMAAVPGATARSSFRLAAKNRPSTWPLGTRGGWRPGSEPRASLGPGTPGTTTCIAIARSRSRIPDSLAGITALPLAERPATVIDRSTKSTTSAYGSLSLRSTTQARLTQGRKCRDCGTDAADLTESRKAAKRNARNPIRMFGSFMSGSNLDATLLDGGQRNPTSFALDWQSILYGNNARWTKNPWWTLVGFSDKPPGPPRDRDVTTV